MRDGSRRERTARAARVLISEAPRDFQVLLWHHSKDTITSPASSSLSSSLNSEPIKIDHGFTEGSNDRAQLARESCGGENRRIKSECETWQSRTRYT